MMAAMGRIICQVTVRNALDRSHAITFDGMVDTGASHLVLPSEWRERLGDLRAGPVALSLANKEVIEGQMCGPVEVEIEGFRPVFTEALFVEMQPGDRGQYEALIGYTLLEMIPVAVDMLGHRLVHAGALDLK
jgi:predicted aspartyl protease